MLGTFTYITPYGLEFPNTHALNPGHFLSHSLDDLYHFDECISACWQEMTSLPNLMILIQHLLNIVLYSGCFWYILIISDMLRIKELYVWNEFTDNKNHYVIIQINTQKA